MYKLLKHLFFTAYWTAFDLGERRNPQSNAEYLTALLIALNIFGIFEILMYFGIKVSSSLIALEFFLAYLLVFLLFTKNNRFKKDLNQYKYLSYSENKSKRYTTLILAVVWSIVFVAFGAIIR